MARLQQNVATVAAELNANINPANETPKLDRKRIPMNVPRMSGETAGIPGYFLYWFNEEKIDAAVSAGYTFVNRGEVELNNMGLGNSSSMDGNSDMGSRVSRSQGRFLSETGQPARQYLMKLPNHLRQEDIDAQTDQSRLIASTLKGEGALKENQYINETHRREMVKNTFSSGRL